MFTMFSLTGVFFRGSRGASSGPCAGAAILSCFASSFPPLVLLWAESPRPTLCLRTGAVGKSFVPLLCRTQRRRR